MQIQTSPSRNMAPKKRTMFGQEPLFMEACSSVSMCFCSSEETAQWILLTAMTWRTLQLNFLMFHGGLKAGVFSSTR